MRTLSGQPGCAPAARPGAACIPTVLPTEPRSTLGTGATDPATWSPPRRQPRRWLSRPSASTAGETGPRVSDLKCPHENDATEVVPIRVAVSSAPCSRSASPGREPSTRRRQSRRRLVDEQPGRHHCSARQARSAKVKVGQSYGFASPVLSGVSSGIPALPEVGCTSIVSPVVREQTLRLDRQNPGAACFIAESALDRFSGVRGSRPDQWPGTPNHLRRSSTNSC